MVRGQRTPVEAWSVYDASMAAAYLRHLSGLCHSCRHPLDESTSEGANPGKRHREDRTHQYVTTEPQRCYACEAAIETWDALRKSEPHPESMRFFVERRDV